MKHTLTDIRTISRKGRVKKDKRIDRMLAKMEASDVRQTKRIIAKLKKSILKAAKKGNFRFYHIIDKCNLTTEQQDTILNYFQEQGYVIDIEEMVYTRFPNDYIVTIEWY